MQQVRLLPGSNISIFSWPQWLPIVENNSSHELWVDYWNYEVYPTDSSENSYTKQTLEQYIKIHSIQKLVFYDIFHYGLIFDNRRMEIITHFQKILPTSLVTICKKPIPGLANVVHFDFYWNRCKQAYLDKKTGWKQLDVQNFNQWPMLLDRRPLALLSLYGQNNQDIKKHLYNAINHVLGYHGGLTQETVLPCETGETERPRLTATPPARRFFDSTYVSAQLESLIKGPNVIFCEKTYDHLIQGRFVLNFGPRHYYRTLVENGWKLPTGIDFGWDDVADQATTKNLLSEPRFNKYIECLIKLTADKDMLHELFVANTDVFAHNQQQLQQRPYDIFNLEQLDHKYS
jgi:hypothetical protein